MLCSWEGNRLPDVTLAVHRRVCGLSTYGLSGLREVNERETGTPFTFYTTVNFLQMCSGFYGLKNAVGIKLLCWNRSVEIWILRVKGETLSPNLSWRLCLLLDLTGTLGVQTLEPLIFEVWDSSQGGSWLTNVHVKTSFINAVYVGTDLQEAFERVDHDRDGVINVAELEEIACSLNLNLSHAQAEAVVSRFGSKGQSQMIIFILTTLLITDCAHSKTLLRQNPPIFIYLQAKVQYSHFICV